MLAFFLTLFQALRVQMGVAFTGQIIHTFLSMFTRLKKCLLQNNFYKRYLLLLVVVTVVLHPVWVDKGLNGDTENGFTNTNLCNVTCMCSREQLAASILQEGSAGCRVVQKFLKILQVVVQEPGQAFKPFLPSILSLCMEQVYPVVAEVSWCSPFLS